MQAIAEADGVNGVDAGGGRWVRCTGRWVHEGREVQAGEVLQLNAATADFVVRMQAGEWASAPQAAATEGSASPGEGAGAAAAEVAAAAPGGADPQALATSAAPASRSRSRKAEA